MVRAYVVAAEKAGDTTPQKPAHGVADCRHQVVKWRGATRGRREQRPVAVTHSSRSGFGGLANFG